MLTITVHDSIIHYVVIIFSNISLACNNIFQVAFHKLNIRYKPFIQSVSACTTVYDLKKKDLL